MKTNHEHELAIYGCFKNKKQKQNSVDPVEHRILRQRVAP